MKDDNGICPLDPTLEEPDEEVEVDLMLESFPMSDFKAKYIELFTSGKIHDPESLKFRNLVE